MQQARVHLASHRAGRTAATVAAARSRRPVVVGPWLAEVGFELLYWIPFVRGVAQDAGLDPERVVVVSRGGVAGWYGELAGRYVDLFDLIEPTRLASLQADRIAAAGGQKQLAVSGMDRDIYARVQEQLGQPIDVLHPSLMFRRFRPVWMRLRSPTLAYRELVFGPMRLGRAAPPARPYVAVKPYFSSAFPDEPGNRELVRSLVLSLATMVDVVTLTTGLNLDDHAEPEIPDHPAVRDGLAGVRPADNLAVQTALIASSRLFVGTYGGPAYLAPLVGVPAVGLFSAATSSSVHLDVLRHGLAQLGHPHAAGISLVDARHLETVSALAQAVR